jgi:hypothetical protein
LIFSDFEQFVARTPGGRAAVAGERIAVGVIGECGVDETGDGGDRMHAGTSRAIAARKINPSPLALEADHIVILRVLGGRQNWQAALDLTD